MTWTPTLSHFLLRRKPSGHSTATTDLHGHVATGGFMGRLTRFYGRMLGLALSFPWVLAAGLRGSDRRLVLLLQRARQRSASRDGRRRLRPRLPHARWLVARRHQRRPDWASKRSSLKVPEIESLSRRTGLQLGLAAVTEANTGDFLIKLKRDRKRGVEEIISQLRDKIGDEYPQLDIEFAQVLQDMIGDLTSSPEPIEIKLFSQNPDLLKTWGPKVGDAIKKVSFVKDVKDGIENTISGPALVMHVDPVVAARAGFSPQEVELDASAILQGEPATTPVITNGRSYTIRVRFPDRHPQIARSDQEHDDHQQFHGQERRLLDRSPPSRTRRARPKSAAKTCSAISP